MPSTFLRAIHRFWRDESGPTSVEYAVALALIVVACAVSLALLSTNANRTYTNVANAAGRSGSSGSHAIGATVNGGTLVSGGIWSWNSTMGPNVMEIYNADTGVDTWSWTGSNGPWYTATRSPGRIPGGTQYTWTRTQ